MSMIFENKHCSASGFQAMHSCKSYVPPPKKLAKYLVGFLFFAILFTYYVAMLIT